jgi:hypothetical protein
VVFFRLPQNIIQISRGNVIQIIIHDSAASGAFS